MRDVWYQVDVMDSVWAGAFNPMFYCPMLASSITQVEIKLDIAEVRGKVLNRWTFWRRVQELFPSVKRVALTCDGPKNVPFDIDEDFRKYVPMAMGVDLVPPGITPLIALRQSNHLTLWKLGKCDSTTWHLVEDPWTPTRVMLPPKNSPPGFLHDLICAWQMSSLISKKQVGLQWLMWETERRSATKDGLVCPRLGCERWFQDGVAWWSHISKPCRARVEMNDGHDCIPWFRNTAAEVKAILDDRQQRIDQMYKEFKTVIKRLQLQPYTPELLEQQMMDQGYHRQGIDLWASEL